MEVIRYIKSLSAEIERLQDFFTRELGGAWAPPSRELLDAVVNQLGTL
mgnify:CR=1 FL=1